MAAGLVLILVLATWHGWRWLNRKLYNDAFSPFNLLFYFWIAPLILSFAELSGLQTGLNSTAALVVGTSSVVLVITCLLPSTFNSRLGVRKFDPIPQIRHQLNATWIVVFYSITLVSLYFAEFSDRDLPLTAYLLVDASDSNLHTAGKDSKLQIIAFGIQSAAMYVFYLWLYAKTPFRRVVFFVLSILVVAIGFVKASKSDIYVPILTYSALIYYHHRDLNRRLPAKYKLFALISIVCIISVTSIRLDGVGIVGGYASLIDFKYSAQLGAVASEIVSIVYGYTSLGFQNFSNYVGSHAVELRVGTSMFRPLLSALMMGNVADQMSVPVDTWNVVSDAANTGTFLTPLYIEGGPLFCILGSLFYGLFINAIYASFISPTDKLSVWKFLYISLIFPWTWLFFTNAFSVFSIYVNLVYVIILFFLFSKVPFRLRKLRAHIESRRAASDMTHAATAP